jgi:hypothetical protein
MYKGQGILNDKDYKSRIQKNIHPKVPFTNMHGKTVAACILGDRNKVVMMPRDPNCIYIYWDFSSKTAAEMRGKGRRIEGTLEIHSASKTAPIPVKFSIHKDKEMEFYLTGLDSYVEYWAVLKLPEFNLTIESNKVVTPKNFEDPA